MGKFLFVPVSGEIKVIDFEYTDPNDFNNFVHETISCEYYELVSIGRNNYMVVDELGKVLEDPKPVNVRASTLYLGTPEGDPIVGDVLIGTMGTINGEPDLIGLESIELERLLDYFAGITYMVVIHMYDTYFHCIKLFKQFCEAESKVDELKEISEIDFTHIIGVPGYPDKENKL